MKYRLQNKKCVDYTKYELNFNYYYEEEKHPLNDFQSFHVTDIKVYSLPRSTG